MESDPLQTQKGHIFPNLCEGSRGETFLRENTRKDERKPGEAREIILKKEYRRQGWKERKKEGKKERRK